MPNPTKYSANDSTRLESAFVDDLKPSQTPDLSSFQRIDTSGAELVSTKFRDCCVRLDMQDLQQFEILEHQYEKWGVSFQNAIALQPSNPAFPTRAGKMVVMGAPRAGWIEAKFHSPVSCVNSFVTSSRRLVLSAFDACDRPVAHVEMEEPNLGGSDSQIPPNTKLSLTAANIHRITLSCLDGHITLDELSFSA